MYRARRLAAVVVAALAVTGLSACRSAPDVAAYVGSDKITEARVGHLVDEAKSKRVAGTPAAPITRQKAVDMLVGLDVMQAIAKQRGVSPTAVQVDQVATSLGLATDSEYLALFVRYQGLLGAVASGTKPATPTEADLRDVYNRLTAAGGNPDGQPFQQFVGSLTPENQQTLQQNFGLRNDLEPQITRLDVVANPKYNSWLPLVTLQDAKGKDVPLVVVPFATAKGSQAPTVVDVS